MFRKPDGAGKGDAPRPIKDQEKFSNNWDAIFKKKEPKTIEKIFQEVAEAQILDIIDEEIKK